jgi:hypothetical protein
MSMLAINPNFRPKGAAIMNNRTVCYCSVKTTAEEAKVEEKPVEQTEETTLEEARELYKAKFQKDVPTNKKNDKEWILSKLN